MKVAFAAFALLVLTGCQSSNTLTRSNAKSLIDSYFDSEKGSQLGLTPKDVATGVEMGYWSITSRTGFGDPIYSLSTKGQMAFNSWRGGGIAFPASDAILNANCQTRMKVEEITGISDVGQGGAEKLVEFSALPRLVGCESDGLKNFVDKSHSVRAMSYRMKRYDDGWRLER